MEGHVVITASEAGGPRGDNHRGDHGWTRSSRAKACLKRPKGAIVARMHHAPYDPSSDRERFNALVREHYARLCYFVRRYIDAPDDAEDIVQDVFVRVWERVHDLDFDDPLPYLYQATRNAATSALRKHAVRMRWRDAELREGAGVLPRADTRVEDEEFRAAVAMAVAELPDRCREIFTMHREQQLSYQEIAHILGLSPKTVENQIGRALRMLRGRLAPYLEVMIAVVAGAAMLHP